MKRPEVVVVERINDSGVIVKRSIREAYVRGNAAGRTPAQVLAAIRSN